MKRLLLLLMLTALKAYGAAESDLTAGIDPTAYTSVSGSQLLQLVQNGSIRDTGSITNNKGIIMRSTVAPDTSGNSRMTNWLWLDVGSGLPGTLKAWNGSAWVASGIGTVYSTNIANGAVGQAQLGTNAVDTVNIVNNAVTSAKIGAGQVLNTHLGLGVISNACIADLTIQGGKLAYNTILNTNLIDGSIGGAKLQSGTLTSNVLAAGSVNNIHLNTNSVASSNIISGSVSNAALASMAVSTNNIATNGATALQVLQMNSGSSFIGWATPVFPQVTNIDGGTISAVAFGVTNTHGLGAKPSMVYVTMTNTVAEKGYAIGDEIPLVNDGASVTIAYDATSVVVLIEDSLPVICNRVLATGHSAITANRWGLKIKAYK